MTTALVVIDVQEEYFSGLLPIVSTDRMGTLDRIGEAMDAATASGVPVVVVRHTASAGQGVFQAGTASWQLRPEIADRRRDLLVDKRLPGSFTGTSLEATLHDWGSERISVVGYTTNVCCDTTTRQAMHLGLGADLLVDAVGAPDLPGPDGELTTGADLHRISLTTLGFVGADLVDTGAWTTRLGDQTR